MRRSLGSSGIGISSAAIGASTSDAASSQRFGDAAADARIRARDRGDAARQIERVAHLSTFIGTQATSLYSWFSPPIAQMKL